MEIFKRLILAALSLFAVIVLLPLVLIDIICFVYLYVGFGKFYSDYYYPLLIVVSNWIAGNGWVWKKKQDV